MIVVDFYGSAERKILCRAGNVFPVIPRDHNSPPRPGAVIHASEVIVIDSDDEKSCADQPPKRRKVGGYSGHPNAANAARGAIDASDPFIEPALTGNDAALAHMLQAEEVRLVESRVGVSHALAAGISVHGGVTTKAQDAHPFFRADGLGFWLLYTEGLKVQGFCFVPSMICSFLIPSFPVFLPCLALNSFLFRYPAPVHCTPCMMRAEGGQ